VHLRCHKSTVSFQKTQLASFWSDKRWRSKIFPLIRWPFRDAGREHYLYGMSPIVEISDSVELRLALSVQHLKSGRQIALRESDSSSTKPREMRFNALQRQYPAVDKSIHSIDVNS
jgi:hypothetical protein